MDTHSQDAKRFAKEVLPHHFKTANFNSFVRQLNFYGFRKINYEESTNKHLHVSVTSSTAKASSKSWEFHHPQFIRGRTELLDKIKRKTYADSSMASKEELESLRSEVTERTALLKSNTERMQKLEDLCASMRAEIASMKNVYQNQITGRKPFLESTTSTSSLPMMSHEDSVNSLSNFYFGDEMKIDSEYPSMSSTGGQGSSGDIFDTLTWKFDEDPSPVDNSLLYDIENTDIFVDDSVSKNNMDSEHSEVKDQLNHSLSMLDLGDTRERKLSLEDLAASESKGGDVDESVEVEAPAESQRTLERALSELPEGMNKQQFLDRLITTLTAMFPQAREAYEKYQQKQSTPLSSPAVGESFAGTTSSPASLAETTESATPTPAPETATTADHDSVTKEYAAAIMMACLLPQIQMALLTTVAASSIPTTAYCSLSGKV